MTLIVGIKCSNGIVIGADGAATYGSMGSQTIRQSVRKLTVLQSQAIVGCAGAVGLAQRIVTEVDSLFNQRKFAKGECTTAMVEVRKKLLEHIKVEAEAAQMMRQIVPGAVNPAISLTLLAVPVNHVPCLCQFDQNGAPELASVDLPFVALGSGQPIADPFLAFIRRVFWPSSQPTLAEGIFATVWALQHAILTNPGGVSDPMQVAVLEKVTPTPTDKNAPQWKARELTVEECGEHKEGIEAAEKALKDWRAAFSSGASTSAPPIPAVPGVAAPIQAVPSAASG